MKTKRFISMILVVVLILTAGIEWTTVRSEATEGGQLIEVKGNNTIVNSITVNGKTVNAYYRPYDGTNGNDEYYCCAAFVKRFYNTIYGIDVYNLWPDKTPLASSGGSFVVVTDPQIGDIVGFPGHWAIVKEVYADKRYVIIEQNCHYEKDGKSYGWKDRIVNGDQCTLFRFSGSSGSNNNNGKIDFSNVRAGEVYSDDATINADLPSKPYCSEVGFYISTKSSMANAKRIVETANCQVAGVFYNMKKWYGTLSANTAYYYKFFAVSGGTEYTTGVYSFTTLGDVPGDDLFSTVVAENITENDATLTGGLSSYKTIQDCGFQISTNADMSGCATHYESDKSSPNGAYIAGMGYKMSAWHGKLQKGTVYYYRMFVKINGTTYMTSVHSFKTLGDSTAPVVKGVNIVSVDGSGYTISAKATDETGLAKMAFPTWTEYKGQDDMDKKWEDTTAVTSPDKNGNYTYRVNISDHKNESGKYITWVYAFDTSGNKTYTPVEVYVYPLVSISLSESDITLEKGGTKYLSVGVNPENTTDTGSISFTSSNKDVATVDDTGKVTAKGFGTATITAKVSGKTATCKVTVRNPLNSISFSQASIDLKAGEKATLSVSYNPDDTTDSKAITWTSSDDKIATVDGEGTVTAVAKGTATITATSAVDGVKAESCTVTVSESSAPSDDWTEEMLGEFINKYYGDNPSEYLDCNWHVSGGKSYWYEKGVRQGTFFDPKGVLGDGTVRGREICDMSQTDDAGQQGVWFWLDSVYNGAKAVGKEVWVPYIYQDENKWTEEMKRSVANESDEGMRDLVFEYMRDRKGKWVRYDNNGRMIKGWVTIEGALAEVYPDQAGNTYYYDTRTGLMAKGELVIDGEKHYFDKTTGVKIYQD